ncbi:MAG: hypothetical protein E7335_05765 [Clostridiales bacterium]|nr:hypothetical protein [Clostridiales bacterium]
MKKVYALNDSWLLIDGNAADSAAFHQNGIPKGNAVKATLPCFTHMYFEDHVGISWYEKTFTLEELPDENEIANLHFEQAMFRTEVSVNGKIVGVHLGMEDPFNFDVTEHLQKGENRITVRTSKPHDEEIDGFTFGEVPHRNQRTTGFLPGNNYNTSGLCGEVELRILPRVYIEDLYIAPDVENKVVRIEVNLENVSAEKEAVITLTVCRSPEGGVESSVQLPVDLSAGSNIVKTELSVPSPRIWSTEDPNLYLVTATVSSACGKHNAQKKAGFRTFCVGQDGYFYLNGKRVYLTSSHTINYMPESTHLISRDPELLRKDFVLAKATGFNTIRFIGGAALPIQLDICDEIGLMVYEEPIGSWNGQNGPHTVELYRHNLFSMIKRDRSHACITIWGLMNEVPSVEPTNKVCFAARDILPEVREMDDTRLIFFNSGRWDHLADVGSICNPGSDRWECLWGNDGNADCDPEAMGEVHFYPFQVPMTQDVIDHIRGIGKGSSKPVFMSEIGIGSVFDTVSAERWFMQQGMNPACPDVKMTHEMNCKFNADLERYDFVRSFPFLGNAMRQSEKNHAYYRMQLFDLLRSNDNFCGLNITATLDQSISGEGVWTLDRKLKLGIADVLENGFAPVRWNLILSKPALWPDDKLTVEGSIASVDVLKVGKEYTARAGIVTKDGLAVDVRTFRFTVTEEQAKRMVIPVFHEAWDMKDLEAGEHIFRAEVMEDADVSSVRTFHVCPRPQATGKTVYAAGLTEADISMLAAMGFAVKPLAEYENGGTILAGAVDAETAARLSGMLESGAKIVAARLAKIEAAEPPVWFGNAQDGEALSILPEERRPEMCFVPDWLYHRETLIRPESKLFAGMRAGLADAQLYTGVTYGVHLKAEGAQLPDKTHAMAFMTGNPIGENYVGGFMLGEYHVGKGKMLITTFPILNNAAQSPYAAQLLSNLLNDNR